MFRCEGIAIIKKSHHIYLDSSPTDAQLDTAGLQRIP
jgi:hypothetical protein